MNYTNVVDELIAAWSRDAGHQVVTTKQLASLIQRHPNTVRRAVKRGDLRAMRTSPSGPFLYRLDDVVAWLTADVEEEGEDTETSDPGE